MTGSYTFQDTSGSEDASTFQRYTASSQTAAFPSGWTEIADATEKTFTITDSQKDKFIRFAVLTDTVAKGEVVKQRIFNITVKKLGEFEIEPVWFGDMDVNGINAFPEYGSSMRVVVPVLL